MTRSTDERRDFIFSSPARWWPKKNVRGIEDEEGKTLRGMKWAILNWKGLALIAPFCSLICQRHVDLIRTRHRKSKLRWQSWKFLLFMVEEWGTFALRSELPEHPINGIQDIGFSGDERCQVTFQVQKYIRRDSNPVLMLYSKVEGIWTLLIWRNEYCWGGKTH